MNLARARELGVHHTRLDPASLLLQEWRTPRGRQPPAECSARGEDEDALSEDALLSWNAEGVARELRRESSAGASTSAALQHIHEPGVLNTARWMEQLYSVIQDIPLQRLRLLVRLPQALAVHRCSRRVRRAAERI